MVAPPPAPPPVLCVKVGVAEAEPHLLELTDCQVGVACFQNDVAVGGVMNTDTCAGPNSR